MPGGRPTKLTAAIQKRICDAIRGGNFRETAARWAGVSPEIVSRWMKRPEPQFVRFRQAVLEAEQAAEIRSVALVMRGAQKDPKHAEWWLERKLPDRWGRRDRVTIDLQVKKELEAMLDRLERILDADTFARVLAAIAAESTGEQPAGADRKGEKGN